MEPCGGSLETAWQEDFGATVPGRVVYFQETGFHVGEDWVPHPATATDRGAVAEAAVQENVEVDEFAAAADPAAAAAAAGTDCPRIPSCLLNQYAVKACRQRQWVIDWPATSDVCVRWVPPRVCGCQAPDRPWSC